MVRVDQMSQGKYKDTVNLPETPFPMRGELARREPEIIAAWNADDLYGKILASRANDPLYVLHDGPPYSNSHIHYGHILNKILKDIVVRARTLAGFRAPYIPGYDTHGLPIEKVVEQDLGSDRRQEMSVAEFRRLCRDHAMRYVAIQTREFSRLGILGQWNDPYLTLDPQYEEQIVRALADVARKGYLYRGQKPVTWCPRDKTALAVAEVEYQPKASPSIYVRCPLIDDRGLAARLGVGRFALVIWTTTPWTLPANLAIVAHPSFDYVAIPNHRVPGEHLIVAAELKDAFEVAIGAPTAEPIAIPRAALRELEGARYQHPFITTPRADADFRLWFADYVTADAGTGLVHTAPGHGADDYKTGIAHGLATYAPLDESGRFLPGVALDGGASLEGVTTDDANPIIIDHLHRTGFLLSQPGDKIQHDYAHCWRCKGPIIYRATPQWFIAMDHVEPGQTTSLRERALAEIETTTWVPPWGEARIHGMIANRPDWVLSRQRTWGVPIPTFYCTGCKEPHADAATMDHVATIFRDHGADAWWTTPVVELVPPGTTCGACGAGADKFEREQDIVDVWFESGVSWLAMRAKDPATHGEKPGRRPIDLYLEGSDQHRGWFHSSLLAGVIVRGGTPYREVITHGFVLDENGKEYSKSAIAKAKAAGIKTDYIEPDDVIAKSGAETFRMWVASVEYRNDMTYSPTILATLSEWYRKFRNTARFVLGSINDYKPRNPKHVDFMKFRAVDRYMLGRIADLVRRCRDAYDKYEHHLVHRALVDFVTIDLSAFYSDVVKDRLYCDPTDSDDRRAVQVVLHRAIEALAILASPIMCFTAEDIWKFMPHEPGDPASVHMARWSSLDHAVPEHPDFAVILDVRDAVLKQLEAFRAAKHKSTDARVVVHAPAAQRDVLARHAGELAEIFIVSEVELAPAAGELRVEVAAHGGPRCERCWRHFAALSSAADYSDVCERCERALRDRRSKS